MRPPLSLNEYQQIRTESEGLIGKDNSYANIALKMENKMIVGYARISTDGQSLEAQQSALADAGAERIFARYLLRCLPVG